MSPPTTTNEPNEPRAPNDAIAPSSLTWGGVVYPLVTAAALVALLVVLGARLSSPRTWLVCGVVALLLARAVTVAYGRRRVPRR